MGAVEEASNLVQLTSQLLCVSGALVHAKSLTELLLTCSHAFMIFSGAQEGIGFRARVCLCVSVRWAPH